VERPGGQPVAGAEQQSPVRPGRVMALPAAAELFAGDALPHLGDHLGG
jgi:hypothetical protein